MNSADEKIFRDGTRSQKTLIVSLLQRILLSHSRVSEDDDDMATAYVARFTRRILGVVGQASRAASPGIMDSNGSNEDTGFMAELVCPLSVPRDDADAPRNNSCRCQIMLLRTRRKTKNTGTSNTNPDSGEALIVRSMMFAADPTNNFAPMPNASFPGFSSFS